MPHTVYIDGGARGNPGPAGCGVEIYDPNKQCVFAGGFFLGKKTNNQAEYQGLLFGLRCLAAIGADPIQIVSDSELMVRQINGQYKVKSPALKELYAEARRLLNGFKSWTIRHVFREDNTGADRLANLAMDMGEDEIEINPQKIDPRAEISTEQPPLFEDTPPKDTVKSNTPAIEVRVREPSTAGSCPAKMERGETFMFTHSTPAGFCCDAMRAVLPALLTLRNGYADKARNRSSLTVSCDKPGCAAVFEIRLLD